MKKEELAVEAFKICQDTRHSFLVPANFEACVSQYLRGKYDLKDKEIRDIDLYIVTNYDKIKRQVKENRGLFVWRPR